MKHPTYGYLSKSEFEQMQAAPANQSSYWLKLAEKREKEAQKTKRR